MGVSYLFVLLRVVRRPRAHWPERERLIHQHEKTYILTIAYIAWGKLKGKGKKNWPLVNLVPKSTKAIITFARQHDMQ